MPTFSEAATRLVFSAATRALGEFSRATITRTPVDERTLHWEPESGELERLLSSHYPKTNQGVATPSAGGRIDGLNSLRWCAFEAIRRATRAVPPDLNSAVNEVVSELQAFLESSLIEVSVIARVDGPLLPELMSDPIAIDSEFDLQIVRLCNELVDRFELPAGPLGSRWLSGTFALLSKCQVPVRFGAMQPSGTNPVWSAIKDMQGMILALRLAVRGVVSIDSIRTKENQFSLAIGTTMVCPEQKAAAVVPTVLDEAELDYCLQMYRRLKGGAHPVLRRACERLAQSRLRHDHQDAILDAAIGLEAILLHGSGHQELRFRFSLHYALLGTDRLKRFNKAQSFYDARSFIAHGEEVPRKILVRCCGQKPSVKAVANLGQAMLQECIDHFAKDMIYPAFVEGGFWKCRELGMDSITSD